MNEQSGKIVCIFLCSILFSSVALHFTLFVTSIIILSSHLVDPPHYMRGHFVDADDSRCVPSLSPSSSVSVYYSTISMFQTDFFYQLIASVRACIVASDFSLSQIYDFHFHFRAANV